MPINNYLVIGVNPTNNETSVPTDKGIVITFAKHMDQATLTSSNLVLKEVNGESVSYTLSYDTGNMTATLSPTTNLKAGTQYQIQIMGTATGVKSITGDYIGTSKTYEFTTKFGVALSPPVSLKAAVDTGFVTLNWERPADYDPASALSYEIKVSTSNDVLNPSIWPSVGDINKTIGLVLNVPKKLSEGSYYAYVRALNEVEISEWAMVQFAVQAPVIVPSPSQPGAGGGDMFSFDVVDTYPRRDDVDVTPGQVMLVFSSDVDASTINVDSIYIIKKEDKQDLNLLDFMTDYSPTKKITATIEPITNPKMVVLTATLEDDAEYTAIVRESVKNSTGSSLGIAYHWSFMTKFTSLYGDAEMIKGDVGGFIARMSNKILYKTMRDNSIHAFNITSQTANFQPEDYEDGKAPYYIHQYVRYKTAYDLLMNGYIQSSNGTGASVTLGDLTVDKKSSQADISSLLKEFKERIKPWEDAIHGHNNRGYAKPSVVVRGENVETYPDFLTRTEFNELGQ